METKTAVSGIVLALFWFGEIAVPFYLEFQGRVRSKLLHDSKNLVWGLCNAAILAFLFAGTFAAVESWSDHHGIGLLRFVALPLWAEFLVLFFLFDLWMYLWHRANHRFPLLWRFHRMHHSDSDMDVSTAVRFHSGEIILSAVAQLAVLTLLGMELWQLALYETVFMPVVLFHHANVRIPRWLDYGLLAIIVTPAMHRVHHSRWQPETDSNYGSVVPYWDFLFRTFRLRRDAHDISIGLAEADEKWQSVLGMIKTPLLPTKRSAAELDDQ